MRLIDADAYPCAKCGKAYCITSCDEYWAWFYAIVDAAPKWISVQDDRKPKHLQEVLCTYVFDGWPEQYFAVLTFYAYGDNGYVTGMHFEGEGLHDMKVTHWMPLPEPPEKLKEEPE